MNNNNWKLLKDGNKKGLSGLYTDHISDMVKYGCRFSTDDSLVEDCIHDLFIDLWKHRKNLPEKTNIKGYILISLRRKIIRSIKIKNKYISISNPLNHNHQYKTVPSFELEIIENEENNYRIQKLNKALNTLSKKQREIIYLKFKIGMDNKSIAETLNINYQSVRNLLSRTIKILRNNFSWYLLLHLILSTKDEIFT